MTSDDGDDAGDGGDDDAYASPSGSDEATMRALAAARKKKKVTFHRVAPAAPARGLWATCALLLALACFTIVAGLGAYARLETRLTETERRLDAAEARADAIEVQCALAFLDLRAEASARDDAVVANMTMLVDAETKSVLETSDQHLGVVEARLDGDVGGLRNATQGLEAAVVLLRIDVEEQKSVITNEELVAIVDQAKADSEAQVAEFGRELNETTLAIWKGVDDELAGAMKATLKAADDRVAERVAGANATFIAIDALARARKEDLAVAVDDAAAEMRLDADEAVRFVGVSANETVARVVKRAAGVEVATIDAVEAASAVANATAAAAMRDLIRTAAESDALARRSLDQVNSTANGALKRIAEREVGFGLAVDAAEAEISLAASSVEARLSESTAKLASLEEDMGSYEDRTETRFEKQSAVLRAWVAGFFAMVAALLTMRHVYAHTTHMAFPEAQRKVLAILWMVPIYAVTSWAAIVWPGAALEVQLVSSIYEAYAVHMFFALLVAILSDGRGEDFAVATLPPKMRAPFVPPTWCWPWKCEITSASFLAQCKAATLQFVVAKPVLAILDYAFSRTKRFRGEIIDYTKPQLWITLLLNASVSLALTSLFAFFHATQHSALLKPHRPWPKFVAIKGVVFMTWFQGIAITLALKLKLGPLGDERLASAFQNFLVCVEMFVAALAHAHIFGAEEWQPDYQPVRVNASFTDNLALHDFVRDFRSVMPRRRPAAVKGAPADDLFPRPDEEAKQEADGTELTQRPHSRAASAAGSLLDADGGATLV
ncbi:organic solute transporter Ostalpha-domain-containing protein [Pelagophyceae sp. CCMP2097]|nr:organic solute transporter Ostalpha-domain-containing protein [Pelagophyceae sp. CCMP2097]